MTSLPQPQTEITCSISDHFAEWLARSGGTVALTTYQAGKVAFIGWDGQQVSLLMRDFSKPLGMAVSGSRMALATRNQILEFANSPLLARDYVENQPGRYDALYLPRVAHHTGDLHTHDLAYDREGLLLVNTRFSCLARLSRDYTFEPVWRPKFVTDLVPEDRCHLNGVALRDGAARYVTALGQSDTAGGWRDGKASGGVILDVTNDAVVVDGLSMPHSPRWQGNALWVLNSGTGELLLIDVNDGRRRVVCQLPGYLRGLTFVGPFALVGMSKIREKHIFGGLPIQQRHAELVCGVAVVDLRTGAQAGRFEFPTGCSELYDVQFLPGIRRPMILNTEKDTIYQAMTNPDSAYWLRKSAEIKEGAGMPATEADSAGGMELPPAMESLAPG
jgi:uncharacterized protein (TIGR03032 family)